MITILSKDYVEVSTEDVIDWLTCFGEEYKRINGEFFLDTERKQLIISNNSENEKNEYTLGNSNIFWFRRWNQFEYENSLIDENDISEFSTKAKILDFLKRESSILSNYLFSKIAVNKWIDAPGRSSLNKLLVLDMARMVGLNIPETLVTNNKNDLRDFIKKHKQIITKPLSEVDIFSIKDKNYFFDTKLVDSKAIEAFPHDFFYTSLFQEAISKKYEIRIFWLDGQFYSMAIFSQRRKESKYDFRVYDFQNPDRTVPYNLDEKIKVKLSLLVKGLGYKHCSIDCIMDKSDKIIFLEINPVGQFGMVSKPCNYYLEKKLAEYLCLNNKNNE